MKEEKRFKKLSHSLWECTYHIVFCPKYRYKIFKKGIEVFATQEIYGLCRQKDEVTVVELNVQEDHVHIVLTIPPKYSVSELVGFLKGKLAIRLFSQYKSLGSSYWGRHLWARGYCVSTVGINEEQIRKYVRWQEQKEKMIEKQQLGLFDK